MISKTSVDNSQSSNNLTSSKSIPVLLEEIQELAIPVFDKAFKIALDRTDTSFFQRAEKGKTNNEQNLYFDAMRELRLGRQAAESSFNKGLRARFANFPSTHIEPSASEPSKQGFELSLVQDDDLEEDIALEAMVKKATDDNREALYHLSMRLDALVADTHIDESNNPLSPELITQVLALAVSGIELDIRCKIILFKQFDLTVMASLKTVLRKSNQALIDAGVLPDLRYKASKGSESDSERAEQLTEALVSNLAELGELGTSTPGPEFIQLQDLLSKARSSGLAPVRLGLSGQGLPSQAAGAAPGGQGQAAPIQSVFSSTDLVGLLDSAQSLINDQGTYALNREMLNSNNLTVLPPSVVSLSIKDALAKNDAQDPKSLEEENEDVINLVEILFEIILEDDYLPSTIQALISRLQIPIIKVALKDRSFFNQANHPARKLLNELSRVSIGWVPLQEGKADNLLENIYDVVHTICNVSDLSIELFEEQYVLFRKKCEKELKRINLTERRTREYELGASKVKHAKKSIKASLDALCVGNSIPEVVENILFGAWSKVLYSTFVNEGPRSQKWQDELQTAEDLIWSVQPQADANYQGKRAKLLPKLLKNLHTALTEISYDPFEMNALFSRLESAHIAAFKARESSKLNTDESHDESNIFQNDNETLKQSDDIEVFVKQTKHKINLSSKKTVAEPNLLDDETLDMLKNLEECGDSVSECLTDQNAGVEDSPSFLEKETSTFQPEAESHSEDITGDDQPLTAIQRQKVQFQQQESELLKTISEFNVNTWFVFQLPGDKEVRCKLIEKISDTEELVFVNRKGQKAFVKSYEEMAKDLRTEAVRVLSQGSLVDKAFSRLVGRLKGEG